MRPPPSQRPLETSSPTAFRYSWRRDVAKVASSPIYGNGGGKDLEKAGAVFAGDLTGTKLRILVSVLLGMGMTLEEMRPELAAIGG